MRVIFMGTPDFAVAALKRLHQSHEIVAVYTQPSRPAGRGQKAKPSPVQVYAEQNGLAVRTPASLKSTDVQNEFAAFKADVAVVAAYGLILPQAVLDAPRLGCINIHASLLPRWRGAAPIQRAIMAGDEKSGVTIMQMDAGLDTGAMLLTREVGIDENTTASVLHDALAERGGELILEAIAGLESGTVKPIPQPEIGVTYAAKIDKAEAHIDFNRPAKDVLRHINGLSPFPGAWFSHDGERIKILKAELAEGSADPGLLLDDHLAISCADGAIRALSVQRAGKAATDSTAFLRGYALPKGSRVA